MCVGLVQQGVPVWVRDEALAGVQVCVCAFVCVCNYVCTCEVVGVLGVNVFQRQGTGFPSAHVYVCACVSKYLCVILSVHANVRNRVHLSLFRCTFVFVWVLCACVCACHTNVRVSHSRGNHTRTHIQCIHTQLAHSPPCSLSCQHQKTQSWTPHTRAHTHTMHTHTQPRTQSSLFTELLASKDTVVDTTHAHTHIQCTHTQLRTQSSLFTELPASKDTVVDTTHAHTHTYNAHAYTTTHTVLPVH